MVLDGWWGGGWGWGFFFFQAEDGIRDYDVTGVQTCALPILSVIIFFGPNLMAEVDNYIPADPLVTPSHIVANWYLAPFYAILRAIPDKLGGVVLMFAAILILFVLPWLDTSKTKSCNYRQIGRASCRERV